MSKPSILSPLERAVYAALRNDGFNPATVRFTILVDLIDVEGYPWLTTLPVGEHATADLVRTFADLARRAA